MPSLPQPSTPTADLTTADLAVVGAGAAGLYAALCAAREGARVLLVSATPLAQTASYWAQGGLAAALAADDSPERHLADTELAGRDLVRRSAAEILVREAPGCVADLQSLGVRFDADRFGRLALGLEGGHSIRRIVHAGGSATGRRVVRQLSALAAADPLITVFEGARARALWTRDDDRCRGLLCEDGRIVSHAQSSSRLVAPPRCGRARPTHRARRASGCCSHTPPAHNWPIWSCCSSTRPPRSGCPGAKGFLVTEAIRGEGATLHDLRTGERFVQELAPRDEVSRAIQARLRETGASAVGLDMRMIDPAHFPNVIAALREAGLDPARELVPVAPAAHYTMGGIVVDLNARSCVPGLYGVGEVSCTGLHGANRLASNSLSECFVFARRAVAAAVSEPAPTSPTAGETRALTVIPAPPLATPETRAALWRNAGIERTSEDLTRLLDDPHPLARLIARCALARTESRGAHLRLDHPERDPALDQRHAVVSGKDEVSWEMWE